MLGLAVFGGVHQRSPGRRRRRTPLVASLSSATIVYKGMLMALQLERFHPGLPNPGTSRRSRRRVQGSLPARCCPGRLPIRFA